jgi:hypothetical protein
MIEAKSTYLSASIIDALLSPLLNPLEGSIM